MDSTLFIQCHILKADGTEKIDAMDVNDIVFDISKYLDENGELYFCEQIIEGTVKNIAVTKDTYYQRSYGLNLSAPKKKKLGFIHFIITYIWLPLHSITGFIGSVIFVILWALGCIITPDGVAVSFLIIAPIVATNLLVSICTVCTVINLVMRNDIGYILIRLSVLAIIYENISRYIITLMNHNSLIQCIPLSLMWLVVFYACLHKYYLNRKHLFNKKQPKCSTICGILCGLPGLFALLGCMTIYAYSIYFMFQDAIWMGLFGVFVPGISQFVFLCLHGFNTLYAYLCYFAILSLGCMFVMSGVVETEEKRLCKS